jgi:hypothetical protein
MPVKSFVAPATLTQKRTKYSALMVHKKWSCAVFDPSFALLYSSGYSIALAYEICRMPLTIESEFQFTIRSAFCVTADGIIRAPRGRTPSIGLLMDDAKFISNWIQSLKLVHIPPMIMTQLTGRIC